MTGGFRVIDILGFICMGVRLGKWAVFMFCILAITVFFRGFFGSIEFAVFFSDFWLCGI